MQKKKCILFFFSSFSHPCALRPGSLAFVSALILLFQPRIINAFAEHLMRLAKFAGRHCGYPSRFLSTWVGALPCFLFFGDVCVCVSCVQAQKSCRLSEHQDLAGCTHSSACPKLCTYLIKGRNDARSHLLALSGSPNDPEVAKQR